MSIYDVIRDDHRKVEQLFEDIREATDPDDRFALFESLREELTVHVKAEEEVLYKRLEPKMADQMEQSYDEHQSALLLMAKLQDIEPNDPHFLRTLLDLEQAVSQHIEEEEGEILPEARNVIGEDGDNKLAMEFHRAKAKVQERDFEPV